MTTMNGVIRAGMLEGRERGRGSPYARDAEMREMRKGRDLASRFMRGGGGGWELGKSSSDDWGGGAGIDDYASGVSSSSSYARRREVTPSRSREREWELVRGRVCGVECGRERNKRRRRDSEDESVVESTQKRARTLDEESVTSGVGGEEDN